jgi:hypothetical protein
MAWFLNEADAAFPVGHEVAREIVGLEKEENPATALIADGLLLPLIGCAR